MISALNYHNYFAVEVTAAVAVVAAADSLAVDVTVVTSAVADATVVD